MCMYAASDNLRLYSLMLLVGLRQFKNSGSFSYKEQVCVIHMHINWLKLLPHMYRCTV